jgi:putative membrane protein insertion efficiency factor
VNSGVGSSDSGSGRPGGVARSLLWLIEVYRWTLSPLLGGFCRFQPSCSRYASEAIQRHGAWRGARLTLWRLARCQPFHPGGFDPVP